MAVVVVVVVGVGVVVAVVVNSPQQCPYHSFVLVHNQSKTTFFVACRPTLQLLGTKYKQAHASRYTIYIVYTCTSYKICPPMYTAVQGVYMIDTGRCSLILEIYQAFRSSTAQRRKQDNAGEATVNQMAVFEQQCLSKHVLVKRPKHEETVNKN